MRRWTTAVWWSSSSLLRWCGAIFVLGSLTVAPISSWLPVVESLLVPTIITTTTTTSRHTHQIYHRQEHFHNILLYSRRHNDDPKAAVGGRVGSTILLSSQQDNTINEKEKSTTTRQQKRRTWEESFQLLVSYKEQHGNCNVPQRYNDDLRLGGWVNSQRRRKDRLSDERIAKLDAVGFSWSKRKRIWDESFAALVEFKKTYGHCNVPQNYNDDRPLGNWLSSQRSRQDILSEERRTKLDNLGIHWGEKRRAWEESFQSLVSYKEQHGHCDIPVRYDKDPTLGHWVKSQRQRKSSIKDYRIAKLDAVGFSWSEKTRTWDESFEMLVEFKTKHGHCCVPARYSEDPTLGSFVSQQRTKRTKLSDEQRAKLDSIEFSWGNPRREKTRKWDENFRLLMAFKERYGHCNVPQNYEEDPSLARWVTLQHSQRHNLRDERRAKLEDLGFSLKGRIWDERFKLLVAFKEQNGHCNIPRNYLDPPFRRWVASQQVNKATLSDERRVKLDELGFCWIGGNGNHRKWEDSFQLLVAYKEREGHCDVPQKYEQDPRLGAWVNAQRTKKDNLDDDQRTKLEELGFSWRIHRGKRKNKE